MRQGSVIVTTTVPDTVVTVVYEVETTVFVTTPELLVVVLVNVEPELSGEKQLETELMK